MAYQIKSAARRTRAVTGIAQGQIKALNSVLALLPEDSKESDEQLKVSLVKNGQLSPILRRGGRIVDGHRRFRILKQLGRKPWVVDINQAGSPSTVGTHEKVEALGHTFLEINGCRRELNVAVKAAMANALATLKRGSNQHTATGTSQDDVASTLGVSVDTMQRVAAIERGDKELYAQVMRGTVSIPQAVRVLKNTAVVEKVKASLNAEGDIGTNLDKVIEKDVRFNFIYADPPWDYGSGNRVPTYSADPRLHYAVMKLDAIKQLPIGKIAARDAVLWLWTPNCLLTDALDVMKAWGFDYVTSAVWVKHKGPPTQGAILPYHETLLVGHRGQGLLVEGRKIYSVCEAKLKKAVHSKKPDWFAKQAEQLYPSAAKLELFCRTPRKGWHCFGNQLGQQVGSQGGAGSSNHPKKKGRAARVTVRRITRRKTHSSRRTPRRKAA